MKLKFIITLFLILSSQLLQAEITVRVDRNPVVLDESFQLIFQSDKKMDTDADFSQLEKSFTILSRGRQTSTKIFNHKIHHSQEWRLTLLAKKSGMLEIPAIKFGDEFSQPHKIKVIDQASAKQGGDKGDIFIEVQVDNETPYVQTQVIYTVKLFRAVQTYNAILTEPEVIGGQAVINKLGEDSNYEVIRNGKRYSVVQRQYALSPQSSGQLKIEPERFQGEAGMGGIFSFEPFGQQPRTVVERSKSISLDVKPIPDSFTGDTWLPASQLSLQEEWSVSPEKLKQGEATTRTLTLTANGLAASNLPTVDSHLPDKLKQYPDQPELEETNNENGAVGIRREKMAIIPTEAGDFVLPAIKIPWWNTKTDKLEVAELPERTIHVEASSAMPAPAAPTNNVQPQKDDVEMPTVDNTEADVVNKVAPSADQTTWKGVSLLFFILWLITLFVFWKSKRKPAVSDNKSVNESSRRQYLKKLRQACAANDPAVAKQALLAWSKVNWPDERIININSIKIFCDQQLQSEIDELNACLYGSSMNQWNGAAFLKSFESQSFDNKVTKEIQGKLEPLYKK